MRLNWLDILTLTAFPCFIACGQILFKITSSAAKGKALGAALTIFIAQPVFYLALCIYGAGTLFWLWLLTRYPLTLAYPFAAIALIAVPLFDVVFFGARTNLSYWLGLAMIVTGVVVVTRAQGH
jgi:drug/metabolite transporter (DMT)-like permease